MSVKKWHIKEVTNCPPDFMDVGEVLLTFNCGQSCTLTWAPNYCSMTLNGNLPGKASGVEVEVVKPGLRDRLKSISVETREDHTSGEIIMTGTLETTLETKSSTPPGTFAATTTPNA